MLIANVARTSEGHYVRSLATRTLEAIGINDPLRYHAHMSAAELAIRTGFYRYAALQFNKAIPHSDSATEHSAALAGYGEALLQMKSQKEAEAALRQAAILDRTNERSRRILQDLHGD
jgi:hypothetical protein